GHQDSKLVYQGTKPNCRSNVLWIKVSRAPSNTRMVIESTDGC
ncbi:MAG: hypothetical protein ACJAWQ_002234, partial [Paraglaciecola sp.]